MDLQGACRGRLSSHCRTHSDLCVHAGDHQEAMADEKRQIVFANVLIGESHWTGLQEDEFEQMRNPKDLADATCARTNVGVRQSSRSRRHRAFLH